jgi:hypothetical protein
MNERSIIEQKRGKSFFGASFPFMKHKDKTKEKKDKEKPSKKEKEKKTKHSGTWIHFSLI